MPRPLRISTGAGLATLREYSDSQLEYIVYILQLAYADAASAGSAASGSIYTGLGGTRIDSVTVYDTSSSEQTNSTPAPTVSGTNQSYPSYPGIGTLPSGEFPYSQDRTVAAFPSNSDLDQYGWVSLDGSNNLEVPADDAAWGVANEVIQEAVTQISTGNEVGSYRVSTSAPTTGTAGTWTDKGLWFRDDRYAGGTGAGEVAFATYKLWLKSNLTSPPNSSLKPLGLTNSSDANLIEKEVNSTLANIYVNVLLPILSRRKSFGDLLYTVDGSAGANNRGSFSDTKYTTASNSQFATGSGMGEVYYSRSTPNTSGSTTTVNTYYLNMS